jgi:hypothetical protein
MSKLQEMTSALKIEHPANQKMKFINSLYVCGSFLSSWIRTQIRIQGPHRIRIHSTGKFLNNLACACVVYSIVVTYMMRSNARNCVFALDNQQVLGARIRQETRLLFCILFFIIVQSTVNSLSEENNKRKRRHQKELGHETRLIFLPETTVLKGHNWFLNQRSVNVNVCFLSQETRLVFLDH